MLNIFSSREKQNKSWRPNNISRFEIALGRQEVIIMNLVKTYEQSCISAKSFRKISYAEHKSSN